MPAGHGSAASARAAASAAATASGAESNTETVESPSPIDPMRRPPCARHAVGDQLVVAHERLRHRRRIGSHSAVEPSMSDRQNVTTPVGSAAAQPARSRSTSSPGVAGRRAGSVAMPEPDRRLELLGLRRVDALPGGQDAGGRGAGEQRERGRGQRVDVARARRRAAGGELRRAVAGRAARAGAARSAPTTARSRRA